MKFRIGLIIVVILSFFMIKPLWVNGYFPMHDDTQVARVVEMGRALRAGQFPVRWVSDLGYGYGYPIYNFYGPLPYYAGGALQAMGVTVPLIPGIKPVSAMTDVNLLPQTFHIDMPEELVHELSKCRSDEEAREVGIEWSTVQSRDLLKNEVPGIHYYTLGRSDNIARIVKASF